MSTAEFGQLIDREHDFLSQLAMKLTKRRDDADDLTSGHLLQSTEE
jgi:DNA-directed RNA polymerase specialized sigma24 family protein